jgi:phosphoribosyl-ATP pyrophosphohydrolase
VSPLTSPYKTSRRLNSARFTRHGLNPLPDKNDYVAGMADSIDRLYEAALAARTADPASSRTARLLRSGRAKMAKKLAEEAVEVVIDAMHGNRDDVTRESADLIYNLVILWVSAGVKPADVWKEMARRERLFGIAEKLPKEIFEPEAKRKVIALESRRLRKRR